MITVFLANLTLFEIYSSNNCKIFSFQMLFSCKLKVSELFNFFKTDFSKKKHFWFWKRHFKGSKTSCTYLVAKIVKENNNLPTLNQSFTSFWTGLRLLLTFDERIRQLTNLCLWCALMWLANHVALLKKRSYPSGHARLLSVWSDNTSCWCCARLLSSFFCLKAFS